ALFGIGGLRASLTALPAWSRTAGCDLDGLSGLWIPPSTCRPRRHEGPRREFKITWGLRAGYGPSGRIYDLEEAIRAAHRWMRERDARAEPFLSGMFTRGEVIYAGSEAE